MNTEKTWKNKKRKQISFSHGTYYWPYNILKPLKEQKVAEGKRLVRFFFTKADRILKQSEYLRLSRFGRKVHNKHFVAIFTPSRFQRTRLGITVTRKVGSAITRNRIKRFLREYFRQNRQEFAGRWDINIIAKKNTSGLSTEQAFLSLQNIFDSISRSCDH